MFYYNARQISPLKSGVLFHHLQQLWQPQLGTVFDWWRGTTLLFTCIMNTEKHKHLDETVIDIRKHKVRGNQNKNTVTPSVQYFDDFSVFSSPRIVFVFVMHYLTKTHQIMESLTLGLSKKNQFTVYLICVKNI